MIHIPQPALIFAVQPFLCCHLLLTQACQSFIIASGYSSNANLSTPPTRETPTLYITSPSLSSISPPPPIQSSIAVPPSTEAQLPSLTSSILVLSIAPYNVEAPPSIILWPMPWSPSETCWNKQKQNESKVDRLDIGFSGFEIGNAILFSLSLGYPYGLLAIWPAILNSQPLWSMVWTVFAIYDLSHIWLLGMGWQVTQYSTIYLFIYYLYLIFFRYKLAFWSFLYFVIRNNLTLYMWNEPFLPCSQWCFSSCFVHLIISDYSLELLSTKLLPISSTLECFLDVKVV